MMSKSLGPLPSEPSSVQESADPLPNPPASLTVQFRYEPMIEVTDASTAVVVKEEPVGEADEPVPTADSLRVFKNVRNNKNVLNLFRISY